MGIISSAPEFYVKEIANEFGIEYVRECKIELNSEGKLTGNFDSDGFYGKKKSLEDFCKNCNLCFEFVVYHGDSFLGIEPLSISGLGIAIKSKDDLREEMKEVLAAADIVLYDWHVYPLLKIL